MNVEHLEILKSGVPAWNAWRLANPDVRPDLRSANLWGANLRGANLGSANLGGVDLRGANLRSANLGSANLGSANLRCANLGSANLGSANLGGANLRGVDLGGADLEGANLRCANLGGANLGGVDLRGVDLRGVDLRGATMPGGETWEVYRTDVVHDLLRAGGRTIREIADSGAWDCHSWDNCPMHAAFGISRPEDAPPLLRPRIEEFVMFFDADLLPREVLDAALAREKEEGR